MVMRRGDIEIEEFEAITITQPAREALNPPIVDIFALII